MTFQINIGSNRFLHLLLQTDPFILQTMTSSLIKQNEKIYGKILASSRAFRDLVFDQENLSLTKSAKAVLPEEKRIETIEFCLTIPLMETGYDGIKAIVNNEELMRAFNSNRQDIEILKSSEELKKRYIEILKLIQDLRRDLLERRKTAVEEHVVRIDEFLNALPD